MNKFKEVVLGVITGIANGLFGAGGGSILVPGMERFLNMEEHKAHATAIMIILPLTIISVVIYFPGVKLDWSMVLWVSVGGIIGGYMGAKLLNKISGHLLHKIFGAFMIAAAIRMIL